MESTLGSKKQDLPHVSLLAQAKMFVQVTSRPVWHARNLAILLRSGLGVLARAQNMKLLTKEPKSKGLTPPRCGALQQSPCMPQAAHRACDVQTWSLTCAQDKQ